LFLNPGIKVSRSPAGAISAPAHAAVGEALVALFDTEIGTHEASSGGNT